MAKAKIEKEIETWLDNLEDEYQECFFELQEVTSDAISFTVGEEEEGFQITYPKDYPENKEDRFFVSTESDNLQSWVATLNEYADKGRIKIKDLMNVAADKYLKSVLGGGKDEEDDDMLGVGGDEEADKNTKKPKKSQEELEIERKLESKGFLEIGSAQATLRLVSDLKSISKQKPENLGFSAAPVVDKASGLENLYHWHIKLSGVDKDSTLYKDMMELRKKSGLDYVLLEMRFSKDYPHLPPFVRVVRPRFQFRTGHVTLGGSICMELLTNTGWNATNDIESILIQIIAELTSGGARLDMASGTNYEYSEHEAWEAFYRAASTHGWNVNGLSKEMFPKQ
jgi:ubiquitin-conjugating enzyme E2 Q